MYIYQTSPTHFMNTQKIHKHKIHLPVKTVFHFLFTVGLKKTQSDVTMLSID